MESKKEKIEELKKFVCVNCYKESIGEGNETHNGLVCDECFEDYNKCADCGEYFLELNTVYHYGEEREVCEECQNDNYNMCIRCDSYVNDIQEDNNGDYYCQSCRDSGYGSFENEDYDFRTQRTDLENTKNQSKGHGEIIKSDRAFSCEIECYFPDGKTAEKIYQHINTASNKLTGMGISHDGSLNDRGIEYQTPILKGKTGENFIKNFCKLLNDNEYETDSTCGLHIHLDGKDFFEVAEVEYRTTDRAVLLGMITERKEAKGEYKGLCNDIKNYCQDRFYTIYDDIRDDKRKETFKKLEKLGYIKKASDEFNNGIIILDSKFKNEKIKQESIKRLKKLFTLYYFLEPVILQFLPNSRRTSTYCKPLFDDYELREMTNCNDNKEFDEKWYKSTDIKYIRACKQDRYHNTRYNGCNFHSLLAQKHFEIRHHSGTLNSTKILYWIKLHQTIMDYAINNEIEINRLKDIRRTILLSDKRKQMFDFLKLDEPVRNYFDMRAKLFTDKDSNVLKEEKITDTATSEAITTENESIDNTPAIEIERAVFTN